MPTAVGTSDFSLPRSEILRNFWDAVTKACFAEATFDRCRLALASDRARHECAAHQRSIAAAAMPAYCLARAKARLAASRAVLAQADIALAAALKEHLVWRRRAEELIPGLIFHDLPFRLFDADEAAAVARIARRVGDLALARHAASRAIWLRAVGGNEA